MFLKALSLPVDMCPEKDMLKSLNKFTKNFGGHSKFEFQNSVRVAKLS